MTEPQVGTVAIVGLGLIGGSLARDLAARGTVVIGYDQDPVTMRDALDAGVISTALDASLVGIEAADVVVFAVPVTTATRLIQLHARQLQCARLVTDTGSTKTGIAEAARRAGLEARFVGGHPFAGDDRSGWSAARPGLFDGARVLLCAGETTSRDARSLAERLWRLAGGVPEWMAAAAHDMHLAWTSHLPQMLASTLAHSLAGAGVTAGQLGSGGRSMVRLAASSSDMWSGIACENGPRIAAALDRFADSVAQLRELLDDGDALNLRAYLQTARAWAAPRSAGTLRATDPTSAVDSADPAVNAADMHREAAGVARLQPVVAFQGELGAHSEDAARRFFDDVIAPLPCRSFADVAEAVQLGRARYGVLPVENTTAGSIVSSFEVLARPGLEILGEIVRPIRHAMLGVPGASLGRVRRVLSHPVALAQCTNFLSDRPWLEAVAFYDTAGAAREVAHAGDPSLAALAARDAAARYGLHVLASDVQDRDDNDTRFVVIGRADGSTAHRPAAGTRMKSMLFVDVANVPGSLSRALAPFAERHVNLTHIQSTPGDVAWSYRFIIEIEADARQDDAAAAIDEIRRSGGSVRVLGAYPTRPVQRSEPPAVDL